MSAKQPTYMYASWFISTMSDVSFTTENLFIQHVSHGSCPYNSPRAVYVMYFASDDLIKTKLNKVHQNLACRSSDVPDTTFKGYNMR